MTKTIVKQLRSKEYEFTPHLLNPFRPYTNSLNTNVGLTHERARVEMARQNREAMRRAEMEA
jgi:hypothetical protein